MATRFLLSIENLRHDLKPEMLLEAEWREAVFRPVMHGLLAHTQMPESCIDWNRVVANWRLPWPKGRQPKEI